MKTLPKATDLNLDAMGKQELIELATIIGHGVRPIAQARQLFLGRTDGIVRQAKNIRCYCWNKATAMQCRLDGKIQEATKYEEICDRIYASMPDWAKGW
jgi:hypothetical protein